MPHSMSNKHMTIELGDNRRPLCGRGCGPQSGLHAFTKLSMAETLMRPSHTGQGGCPPEPPKKEDRGYYKSSSDPENGAGTQKVGKTLSLGSPRQAPSSGESQGTLPGFREPLSAGRRTSPTS